MGIGNGEPVSELVIYLICRVSPLFNIRLTPWQEGMVKGVPLD